MIDKIDASQTNPRLQQPAYDRQADWYADYLAPCTNHLPILMTHRSVIPAHETIVPAMLSMLPCLSSRGGIKILDICCGTGFFTRHLARLAQRGGGSVMGMDLSSFMLRLARQEGCDHISYIEDDATTMATQSDTSQDMITCCLGITDIANLSQLYQTVHRVLQPDGIALFSLIHPAAPCSREDGGLEAIPIPYHEQGRYTTHNPKSVRGRVPTYHRPLHTYYAEARKAGLSLVDLIEVPAPDALINIQPAYRYEPYGLLLKYQKTIINHER